MTEVFKPADVAALPDGTVIESLPSCLWPKRYAGRRWRKSGDHLVALSPDPFTGDYSCSVIAYFKDPLPADVVEETA